MVNKTQEQIKDTIKKLFAFMDSDSGASPQEAETAMLKAKKLMAKYKLSENDILNDKKLNIITKRLNKIVFSTQVNPWILTLSQVIADNFCCHSVMFHEHGARTRTSGMIGFEEDVEMAEKMLSYAVDCVLSEGNSIRKRVVKQGYSNSDATAMINAIGNGFVAGLKEKFNEQRESEEESFALVMSEPQAVKDYVNNTCRKASFNTSKATRNAREYDNYAVRGFQMGKSFDMSTKLA